MVFFVIGGVNDAASLLAATWMPNWLPGVAGTVLLYVAFQAMGYRLHRAAERLDEKLATVPSMKEPAPKAAEKKRRPAEATAKSHWEPDMSLSDAVSYIEYHSTWRPSDPYRQEGQALEAVRTALYQAQVTAWARQHPQSDEYQLSSLAWEYGVEIRPEDNYAFSARHAVALHGVRLSKGEVEAAWPPKRRA